MTKLERPTPSIRSAILLWLLRDAPLTAKMVITPEHVDQLEDRIKAAHSHGEQAEHTKEG